VKKTIFLLVIAVVPTTMNAQYASRSKSVIWSLGLEPSLPIGNFHNYSGFGLGGSFQGEYKPNRVGITLNAGYIDYFGKTVNGTQYSDFKYIPLLGGVKYYMSNKSYLHGQTGAGFGTNGLGTSFWYGAGLGFNLGRSVDAEIKYMGWKQKHIVNNGTGAYGGTGGTGGYGGTGGGTGTSSGAGTGSGGYGGHYPTIGLRLGYNF